MSIFVQIASYRDPQLVPTIRNMLANADNPNRFVFGICWQYDSTEPINTFDNDPRFRIIKVPYNESKGLGWARSVTNSLYNGEPYVLQLDSHHRFAKGWDTMMIEDFEQAKAISPRPIISTYCTPFEVEKEAAGQPLNPMPCIMKQYEFSPERLIMSMPEYILDFKSRRRVMRSRTISAHFIFTTGDFVMRVPYDPAIYFGGYTEETTLSLRAFTHGYDVFSPYRQYIWHEYTRNNRPKHWDDHNDWVMRDTASKKRTRQLFGMEDNGIYIEPHFGLGRARTLQEFATWAGLDLQNCKILFKELEPPPHPPSRL